MEDKYCPLNTVFAYCKREKCEWWDIEYEKCAVSLLARISNRAYDISEILRKGGK